MPNYHPSSSHCVPLNPCAHCNSPAQFVEWNEEPDGYTVWTAECTECGLQLGFPNGYASRLDLCNDWNKRSFNFLSDDFTLEVVDNMLEGARKGIHEGIGFSYDERTLVKVLQQVYLMGMRTAQKTCNDIGSDTDNLFHDINGHGAWACVKSIQYEIDKLGKQS